MKKILVALRRFRANGRLTDVNGRVLRLDTPNFRPFLMEAKGRGIIG